MLNIEGQEEAVALRLAALMSITVFLNLRRPCESLRSQWNVSTFEGRLATAVLNLFVCTMFVIV